jgi:ABC-type transporter Mla MlaB component
MSVHISEKQGVFYIKGKLNSQNTQLLNQHMMKYFKSARRVVLNLEQIVEIDAKAAFVLLKMFINAVHFNSKFSVIGRNNEKLIAILKETETINIWSQSRILK